MDNVMLGINVISMVATVISCIIAIKAKNEAEKTLIKIQNASLNVKNDIRKDNAVKNEGDIDISNSGKNDGIIGGIITGGINKSVK
ncbi:hypothetical protein [Clostridium estertheticum]|uniref:hypothetical protein n=1 Tax=Clostridium estertheticum TaxID=238834 RepID=UPI001C7D135D|nr:hypothetical protein [Clostridium estertheticum]MBX4265893.1 hypothetical protein [Clostridium estertheticum]WLC90180.1 hypothetical protein KTC95_08355 [Clostridium estertheticum]